MDLRVELPGTSDRRKAVHVSPGVARQLRRGHPWLWRDSIDRTDDHGQAGDLAVVFGPDRKFCAIGLYDPFSPIAVRVLHRGDPTTIDDGFIIDRIARNTHSGLADDCVPPGAWRE